MNSTTFEESKWLSAAAMALLSTFLALGPAGVAQALDDGSRVVVWQRIIGIIEPAGIVGRRPGEVDCEAGVDCVAGAPAPWTVTAGQAALDLDRGVLHFQVRGLVVAGDPSFGNLGTPSVVSRVKGTLVCNDTGPGPVDLVDTEPVALTAQGNAWFRGHVDLAASCLDEPADIVFLIRIAEISGPFGAFLIDLWNAAGVVRVIRPRSF